MSRIRTASLAVAVAIGVSTIGAAGVAAADSTGATVTRTVKILGTDSDTWRYKPRAITVTKGTTVKWTNFSNADHTVTFRIGTYDREVEEGASVQRTFKRLGTFKYYCRFHPDMTGKVVVTSP